jgi:integrase
MAIRPHPTKSRKEPGRHWHVDCYLDGKRKRYPFEGSFEDALEFEKGVRQTPRDTTPGVSPKIKELIIPFLEAYATEALPRTVKDASSVLKGPVLHIYGNLQPKQLTISLFNQYKKQRLDEGVTRRTINKELSYFSSMLKWATEHGHCQQLPFTVPRFPQKLTNPPVVKPLTEKQVAAMHKVIEPEYKLLFLLMADAGLRREEALKLEVEDIDEHNETIRVKGKGNKTRILPFTSQRLVDELKAVLNKCPSGPLSVNSKTGKEYYSIRKALLRAGKGAGIKREVNHHLLRHTFASLAAMRGVSPHALQQLCGHSSIVTTNKIYTHVRHDFVREEAKKLRR